MGRRVTSNARTSQPPPPTQQQRPAAASVYRVVIEPPRGTAPFGSIINDASLLQALNEFGPVFHLEVKSTICYATFKSTATVEALVAAKTLAINGIICSTNYLIYNTSTASGVDDKDEQRLHELFSKQSIKPANLVITESREFSQVIPPGTEIEWRIVITNRSTQDKVLLSIEMPQQRQRNFILRSPMPTLKNPIRVGPGGTHTQGIKFVTKRHELGVFRHTLLLNFSNFIYEHVLVVNVSTPKAAEDLELLKPQSDFVPPTLPDASAPELRTVPAFTVGRDGKVGSNSKVPGAQLYLSNSEYSGKRELKPYPVPPNIHGMIEGRKSASFNPWKVQTNWRTRLHELLYLEEAQQAKLTRAYDLHAVAMEQVTSFVEGEKTLYLPAPMTRVHCANLAEKRPSVQRADRVFAWDPAGGGAQQQFEGYVHRVEGEALVIIFCEDFHARHQPNTKMSMRFDVDRLSARLMHRAVDDSLLDVVWPAQLSPASAAAESQLNEVLHDASLPAELNDQQRRVLAQLTL